MMFKGVTPVTLVIIMMTFLISGIFAMWTSGITSTQRKIVQKCIYSGVIIERGYYKESSNEIILTIHNYGDVDLAFRPIIRYYRGTSEKRLDMFMYVPALDIKTFSIPNVTKDIEEVRIESVPCEEPCFQCPGADAVLLDYEIRKIK